MGLDAGLNAVFDAVLDAVPENVLELAATQRIKCDCAPPRIRRICSRASAISSYASHQPVFTASGTHQIGNRAGLFGLDLSMQRGNSFEAKRYVGKLASQKIASRSMRNN